MTSVKTDGSHPVLSRACADIAALGVRVSNTLVPGATPYLLLAGRSNPRWWLIPLVSGRSAASGFALFQPQLPSARVMRILGITATLCGMPVLARSISSWSIAGQSALAQHYPEARRPVFAYFTGTAGPHRKVTAQVMDEDGTIHGYAKIGSGPAVRDLITREAKALELLRKITLLSAQVPSVRFAGDVGEIYVIATDTRKTLWTASDRTYRARHHAFLEELLHRTRQPDVPSTWFAERLFEVWKPLRNRVECVWQTRIDRCLQTLARHDGPQVPVCLGHGDFTPWNTCRANGGIYVFDWEYFDTMASAGGDLIHFIHSQPHLWDASPYKRIASSKVGLSRLLPGSSDSSVDAMHFIYALTQTLRGIGKAASDPGTILTWDGLSAQADLIDQLLANR